MHLVLVLLLVVPLLAPAIFRGCERLAVGELEQLLQLLVIAEDCLRLVAHLLLLVAHLGRGRGRVRSRGRVGVGAGFSPELTPVS